MAPPSGKPMPAYSAGAQTALLKAVSALFSSNEAVASSPDGFDSSQEVQQPANSDLQSNRIFDLDRTAESLDELTSGAILGSILHQLDPEFDPSHLEPTQGTSKYLTSKRNIQTVYKGLFRFIRRQIPDLACQAKKFDYHAIADNPDAQGISQLLAVMVSAAALGPENQKYVPRIQHNLDRETQAEIMQVLRIVQTDIAASKDDEDIDEAIDAVMEARDVDLLVEEQNAALRQQLETTKKTLSDYITRLEHLQLSHDELRYEKEKNDRELEVLRKATQDGADSAEAVKLLEAQVHEQMEIIATSEESIRTLEKGRAHLEAEVQRLTQRSILADELQDQATEWKHKAEELEKKANTAERYKQKLESQQNVLKDLQNMQYEKADLQEQLRQLAEDNSRSSRTRKAEDELTMMITQSEQHLWEEKSQKNELIRELAATKDELMRLQAQRAHDESYISELQEQAAHGGGIPAGGDDLAGAASNLNLEDELNFAADDGQKNLPLELSRLKAENDLLRRTMGSSGDAAVWRRELEEARSQREKLQQNFNEMFEKHTIAQSQIDALMQNMTGEGAEALGKLRARNAQLEADLESTRKRKDEVETQKGDMGRELISTKSQLSAVESDSVEAMEKIMADTDKLISRSLEGDMARLREKYNFMAQEREAQQSQLIEALVTKDKLRQALEDVKDTQDATPRDPEASEPTKNQGDKIEKLRARLVERNAQLEKSEQEKIDLQRKLKAAHGGEAASAQKAAADEVIKNLRRENNLMASAWYDLTGRLQSNHVVLQRRHDAPKSWMGKQRQMVNATPKR